MRLSSENLAGKEGSTAGLNASLGSDVPIQDIDPEYGDGGNPDAEAEETKNVGHAFNDESSSDNQ